MERANFAEAFDEDIPMTPEQLVAIANDHSIVSNRLVGKFSSQRLDVVVDRMVETSKYEPKKPQDTFMKPSLLDPRGRAARADTHTGTRTSKTSKIPAPIMSTFERTLRERDPALASSTSKPIAKVAGAALIEDEVDSKASSTGTEKAVAVQSEKKEEKAEEGDGDGDLSVEYA